MINSKKLLFNNHTKKYFDSISATKKYSCPEKHKQCGFIKFICSYTTSPKVLDIGCGKGDFLKLLKDTCSYAHLFGIDISLGMLSRYFNKVPLILGSIQKLPFRLETFNIIHLDAVLHHLINSTRNKCYLLIRKALSETISTLAEGGHILIAEPIYEPALAGFVIFYLKKLVCLITRNKRIWGFGAPIVSFYTKNSIIKLLSEFAVIESCYFEAWNKRFYMRPFLKQRGRLCIIARKRC